MKLLLVPLFLLALLLFVVLKLHTLPAIMFFAATLVLARRMAYAPAASAALADRD